MKGRGEGGGGRIDLPSVKPYGVSNSFGQVKTVLRKGSAYENHELRSN